MLYAFAVIMEIITIVTLIVGGVGSLIFLTYMMFYDMFNY